MDGGGDASYGWSGRPGYVIMATEEPRYSTLRDYLALLRRQRLIVIAVTLVFGGAALALSASQEEEYEAESAVQFNDIARDAQLLGAQELPADTNPLVNAAVKAEEVTSLQTAKRVKRELKTKLSPERLQDAVTTRVGSQTIFVQITARWGDPEFAASLSNAFATVVVDGENQRLEDQLDTTVEDLQTKARGDLTNDLGALNVDVLSARQNLIAIGNLRNAVEEGTVVPAEVARRAEVPSAPASPKTARNTVLGLIVGLAIGLLVAFVRDSLDRRLRSGKDAHEEFGWPVLGRVGKSALGTTGAARGQNGAGYVAPADIEAFRILRTNMGALGSDPPVRSVLVTSGVAEEGKSTVAAALAAAATAAGQRVLLVDGDLRRPVLAKRLGLPDGPGLAEYLAGKAGPQDILQTVSVSAVGGGSNGSEADGTRTLVCIPAGNPEGEPAELLASDRCRGFLNKVSDAYDLVVIDSSPLLATADPLELMPHVDGVLICVRLPSSTSEEARAVQEAVRLLPERPTGLVVTGAGATDGYYGYYGY